MFQPIHSSTVVQQIIEKITQSLIRGELKPGDRLPPEPELAVQLGVSRTSLREALKTLGGLGVLVAKKRGGTFIATAASQAMFDPLIFNLIIEKGSKDELFELRVLLEVDAVELAMNKATPADFALLDGDLKRFEESLPGGDLELLAELDLRFHLRILEMSKNQSFIRISNVVMQLFASPIEKTIKQIGPEQVLINHRALFQAMRDKDLLRAKEHIIRSFESSRQFM
ncbi:GntR family transcriptional repressor for pyruvate dehydrogenase complex [Hydrogenispora ethanolica]|uniref:GntR family transcriptional repressor for pyruvate dehydrogenase complex n=1 Tax=Hydrogenispora ethanolica TaxID=1082276 RepID=A0A4V2QFT9_HYDET|nr:FadR/GntR family transcriptional regulator [Hydrogenispora ethanolica]TCL73227.1 GntR family transcriptional repressor for pyruvate dehydrogenase complex [Hydrogenispora ethanolica]